MRRTTAKVADTLMRKRRLSIVVLIVGLLVAPPIQQMKGADSDQAQLIDKAYEYGFPIFEEARLVYLYSYSPDNPQRVPVNSFGHRRALADPTARTVTTPNNDTLYSSAIIDLSAGPIRLDVPDFGTRYFSITFLDAYTNTFAHLGTRIDGGRGGSYLIVGPDWKDTLTEGVIQAPSNHVIAIARILVEGPTDYDAVHRLQDSLKLSAAAPAPGRYKCDSTKAQ